MSTLEPQSRVVCVGDLCIFTDTNCVYRYRGLACDTTVNRHKMEIVNRGGFHYFTDEWFSRVERLYRYGETFSGLVEQSGRWADRVFPNRKPWDTLVRLSMRELPELWANPGDGSEIADAIILAADVGYQQGLDVDQFLRDKIALNETRRWEFRADGLMYHVKAEDGDA